MIKIISLILLILLPSFTYAGSPTITLSAIHQAIPRLEAYSLQCMQKTHIPGLAIAIVYGDQVVYLKALGVRKVGSNEPVNADTVFQLASLSKPLTSTVIANVVGMKKVSWDSQVNMLDPGFELSSPWVTRYLTIRDLLSHRSGLPDHAGDLLEDLGFGRDEILFRLRYLPLTDFRTQYAYTNFGFSEAAYSVAKSLNISFDQLVDQRLLKPLGMKTTFTRYQDFLNYPNRASLHFIVDGQAKPLYLRNADAQAPAGGFSSSMKDYVKWMVMMLNQGRYRDKQIVDANPLNETQSPVIVIHQMKDDILFYGLGWNVKFDHHGQKILSHSGAFYLGAGTNVVLVPSQKIGIAVFSNASPTGVPEAITATFLGLLNLNKNNTQQDWLKLFHDVFQKMSEQVTFLPQPKTKSTSLELSAYVGSYKNDYFGELKISQNQNTLWLTVGPKNRQFKLAHFNRDTFTLQTEGENSTGVTPVIFSIDSNGMAESVYIKAYDEGSYGLFKRM